MLVRMRVKRRAAKSSATESMSATDGARELVGHLCESIAGWCREAGVCAFEILLDHRQRAADEVAVAVGEVGVVALDEGVEGEAAVLAEGDLAEEEVAEDVGGEEVLLVFPVLVAERSAGPVDGLGLEAAEGVEDGLGADDVAAGLGHLRLFEEEPAVGLYFLWQREAGGEQEGGPVDAVEADDLFADEVEVGGPELFELALAVRGRRCRSLRRSCSWRGRRARRR